MLLSAKEGTISFYCHNLVSNIEDYYQVVDHTGRCHVLSPYRAGGQLTVLVGEKWGNPGNGNRKKTQKTQKTHTKYKKRGFSTVILYGVYVLFTAYLKVNRSSFFMHAKSH